MTLLIKYKTQKFKKINKFNKFKNHLQNKIKKINNDKKSLKCERYYKKNHKIEIC